MVEPFPHEKHFKGIIKSTVDLGDLHDKTTAA
jgi:hypothetical protein